MVNNSRTARQFLHLLFVIAVSPASYAAGPQPEELLIGFYSDFGGDLLTGEAVILRHAYQPNISFAKLLPPGMDQEKDPAAMSKYRKYLEDRFDVKTGNGEPRQTWEIFKVYYSGSKKRLDKAELMSSQYDRALAKELQLRDLSWSRCFDDGNRMTSINDQGNMQNDPQATVTTFRLGAPDFEHFGRARCTREQSELMTKLLKSDKFVIRGESTDEGYHVTATSDKSTITRIEAWFDTEQGNRIKRQKTFYRGVLMEEELFSDYITTPNGDAIATKVVRKKYAPVPDAVVDAAKGVSLEPMVSLEETFSVLSADFNLDIPASVFLPDMPIGTTVYDRTVTPAKTYRYGVKPKVMVNHPAKVPTPPPSTFGTTLVFYLTVCGFVAVLVLVVLRIIKGRSPAEGVP
jgi:hypothetical protein